MKLRYIYYILLLIMVGCGSKDDLFSDGESDEETLVDDLQTSLPDWSNGDEYDGEASSAKVITISDVADLVSLAESTHSTYGGETAEDYSGYKIVLAQDVDLDGVDIEIIGTRERPFKGEFDGGGNTISNLRQVSYQNYQGLFGAIGYGAKLHSLKVDGFVVGDEYSKSEVGYGALAGFSGGEIEGCTVTNTTIWAGDKVSLFVGEDNGTLTDCVDGGGNIINIIE